MNNIEKPKTNKTVYKKQTESKVRDWNLMKNKKIIAWTSGLSTALSAAVMLTTGFIRELFAYGTINGRIVDVSTPVIGLAQPFGGFIFLGLFCGLYRWIRSIVISKKEEIRGDADVSGK